MKNSPSGWCNVWSGSVGWYAVWFGLRMDWGEGVDVV